MGSICTPNVKVVMLQTESCRNKWFITIRLDSIGSKCLEKSRCIKELLALLSCELVQWHHTLLHFHLHGLGRMELTSPEWILFILVNDNVTYCIIWGTELTLGSKYGSCYLYGWDRLPDAVNVNSKFLVALCSTVLSSGDTEFLLSCVFSGHSYHLLILCKYHLCR